MEFSIRPFQSGDVAAVDAILRSLWGSDLDMLHVYEYHKDWQNPPTSLIRQTLVAERDGQVVGMGTIFESTYSPHVLFLSGHVASEWQGNGVGARLYDALVTLGDSRPHTVKMTRKDAAGWRFLEKRGYSLAVDSLTGVIDPSSDEARAWLATLPEEVDGLEIVSLDDPACTVTLLEIARTHFGVYNQYHGWSPPAVPDEERVQQWFLGEAVAGTNIAAFYQGKLVGAGNLIATPFDPTNSTEAYMVWVGALESADYDVQTVTRALIRWLVGAAAALGLKVRFEADSTYIPHRAILGHAPTIERSNDFGAMMDGKVS